MYVLIIWLNSLRSIALCAGAVNGSGLCIPYTMRPHRSTSPRHLMPLSRYLQTAAFDDHATKAMGEAFEIALKLAGLNDRSDPLAELIAHKIIQVYRLGEHEPTKLSERALKELGVLAPANSTSRSAARRVNSVRQ